MSLSQPKLKRRAEAAVGAPDYDAILHRLNGG